MSCLNFFSQQGSHYSFYIHLVSFPWTCIVLYFLFSFFPQWSHYSFYSCYIPMNMLFLLFSFFPNDVFEMGVFFPMNNNMYWVMYHLFSPHDPTIASNPVSFSSPMNINYGRGTYRPIPPDILAIKEVWKFQKQKQNPPRPQITFYIIKKSQEGIAGAEDSY